ncbi:MAG TPA: TonB-dependent receptor [Parvularcula sp.]|nr:TonB-dependent receptor [Parvularcula sp.]HBS31767.1 TonB-dependent receptor [Parvularcula sp.]HBS34603.1 TonB-dependent receptor [Parvularcula sp.]
MKTRSIDGRRLSLTPSRFYLTASALALAAFASGAALAQEQEDENEPEKVKDEIIVTGIRGGIGRSLDIKKNETSIVEAISAEEIGKLPDMSIAESLARLPGLAGQRVNGRAQVISIRGLSPDFSTTLLNGRQQASSGDNRAVEFDQYPSELLSSVVVYKTPDAGIIGTGLSGTADLRTVRPLDYEDRTIAMNVRGSFVDGGKLNDDVNRIGTRGTISYIDQFADDTIGVALGYAYLDAPSQNKHFKAYSYEAFGFAVTPDSADSALLVNGQEVFAFSRENKRHAAIGIIEWAPGEKLHATADLYYSRFKQRETMRGAQWFSNGWADGATFTDVQTIDRGGSLFATDGTLNNGVPIIRNDFNKRKDELFSGGLNAEYEATDRLKFIADFSYSNNDRDEQVLETYAGYGLGVGGVTGATQNVGRTFDTIDFHFPLEGFPTYSEGLNYADASQVSLGDRAPWGGWAHDGAIRFPHVEEEVVSVDLRGTLDLDGFIDSIDFGVNRTEREKDKTVDDNDLFLLNGRQQVLVDPQFLVDPTSLSFAGFGNVLSINLPAALDTYYSSAPIRDGNFFDKAWNVQENVWTGFARANIETGALRGNVGVQVVRQTQESVGVVIQGNPVVPTPIVGGAEYTDVLPSLNLSYDLGGGHRIRLSASKTMARPRMDELRANLSPSFGIPASSQPGDVVHPWTARGGNPQLEPWRAKAIDLSYEWYIDKSSYFAVAGFYKKLDNYIFAQTIPFDFTGVPIPSGASIPPGVIIDPIGTRTVPANGRGGNVKGVEVSGALNFGLITDFLDGFGFIGSLSYSDSNINPTSSTTAVVRIPGLSGTVYNITGYYEKDGFQARISQRYRSAFKGEVVQLFATRGVTEILADRQVDAQIGYTFEEGSSLEGLGILFQVNNLTNSPFRTRIGVDGGGVKTADGGFLPETYEEYGREFLLGFSYRF